MKASGRAAAVIALATLALVSPAMAQTEAAAEALFDEGVRLAKEGKYDLACPKLEESQRLDPAIGTLLNLGDCFEHQGKTASAWAAFRDAAAAAKHARQPARAKLAEEHGRALEPRLSRLTITIRSVDPATVVRRDGIVVGRALSGMPIPIDPGAHELTAEAPGRKPFRLTVEIKGPGDTAAEVPELERIEGAAPAAPVAATSGSADPPRSLPPAGQTTEGASGGGPEREPTWRTAGLALGGAGVAAIAAGTFFGLQAMSTYDSRESDCSDNVCGRRGVDLTDSARQKANVSTVFFAVGVLALGGGAALYFAAPARAPATALTPVITPHHAGLSLEGTL
jgi:hypothetical protein